MKKTLVFTAFMGAFIYSASAQPLVQLSPQFLPSDSFQFNSQVHSQSQAKKQGDWFNFIDASDANNGGAISYTIYTNNALFPDSSVKQSYGDGKGGKNAG